MQKSASLRSPAGEHGVVVQSIGSATLTSAAAVAKGLGISAAEVVNCLYKAPAVLVDKVERNLARLGLNVPAAKKLPIRIRGTVQQLLRHDLQFPSIEFANI